MRARYFCITIIFIVISHTITIVKSDSSTSSNISTNKPEDSTSGQSDKGGSAFTGALDGIHMMVDGFLGLVYGTKDNPAFIADLDKIFEIAQLNTGDILTILKSKWKDLMKLYTGLAACIGIGIILLIVMPIVGMCCCCCRSCNKCGGATKKYDPKNAKCKMCVTGFIFLAFSLGIVGCTVIWFMNVEGIIVPEWKDNGVIKQLQDELQLTKGSVSSLYKNDVRTPVTDAANELKDLLTNKTKLSAVIERALYVNWTNRMNESQSFYQDVVAIKQNITDLSLSLSNIATKLNNTNMTSSATNIQQMLTELNTAQNSIDTISANTSDQILNKAVDEILKLTNTTTDVIYGAINDTLREPDLIMQRDVPLYLTQASELLGNFSSNSDVYGKYFEYGRIALLAEGGVMGLVALLFLMGILCGCGERAGPGSSCCNKGTGATCVLAGIGFAFIFYSLFMLPTIIWFAVGSGITTHGCWFLEQPEPFLKQLNKSRYINKDRELKQYLTYVKTYSDCLNKHTLEESLSSIPELAGLFNKSSIQDKFREKIDSVTSGINVTFPDFSSELDSIKNFSFPDTSQLNQTIDELDRTIKSPSQPSNLAELKELRKDIENISSLTENLKDSVETLKNSSFIKAVEGLSTSAPQTQAQVIGHISNRSLDIVNRALDEVMNATCSEVAENVKSGVEILCDNLIQPINNMWFSMGGFVGLVIFTIIFGFCLSNLFRRQNPYADKKYDEDEQPTDNRTSRNGKVDDNIPLQRYESDEVGGFTYANSAYLGDDSRYPHQRTARYDQHDVPFTYNPPPYHATQAPSQRIQPRGVPLGQRAMPPAHRDAHMY